MMVASGELATERAQSFVHARVAGTRDLSEDAQVFCECQRGLGDGRGEVPGAMSLLLEDLLQIRPCVDAVRQAVE
jgi:hypothetical protein